MTLAVLIVYVLKIIITIITTTTMLGTVRHSSPVVNKIKYRFLTYGSFTKQVGVTVTV